MKEVASARPKNRWFHTVVVVGASLGGCGGQSMRHGDDAEPDAGMAGNAGGMSGAGPSGGAGSVIVIGGTSSTAGGTGGRLDDIECAHQAEFTCADYETRTDCRCDPGAPHGPADCPSPHAFRCVELPTGASTPHYVGCSCAADYPTPETCPAPQIVCDETDLGLANCRCDPSRPTSPDQCTRGVEWWRCQSQNPEFGCECACCVIR